MIHEVIELCVKPSTHASQSEMKSIFISYTEMQGGTFQVYSRMTRS